MAARPRLLADWVPLCGACSRRLLPDAAGRSWTSSPVLQFQQQLRGKKSSKQPATIVVRLLKDVKRFGRKGALVPVSSGQMRNVWYPSHTAEYVPATELRELSRKDVPIVRDYQFSSRVAERQPQPIIEAEEVVKEEKVPRIKEEVKLLSPQRAVELLDIFVPQRIDFYRAPIESQSPVPPPPPTPQQPIAKAALNPSTPSIDALKQALNRAVPAEAVKTISERTPIFGSVTTADLANNIKALLAENDEAALVVLTAEDIQFIKQEEEDDKDRVKFIGDYEVEIKVKGSESSVKRAVRVLATSLE